MFGVAFGVVFKVRYVTCGNALYDNFKGALIVLMSLSLNLSVYIARILTQYIPF